MKIDENFDENFYVDMTTMLSLQKNYFGNLKYNFECKMSNKKYVSLLTFVLPMIIKCNFKVDFY